MELVFLTFILIGTTDTLSVQMVCLLAYLYLQISKIYRQTLTLSKCMCMRASGSSELRKFWHFYHSNTAISFNILSIQQILVSVQILIMLVGVQQIPTNFLIYRQTLTLSICMCMRLSGASELRTFGMFTFLIVQFLLIFCRYIRYFVGTNDMLKSAHMYRQISICRDKLPNVRTKIRSKHYLQCWGQAAPPAPPLSYTNGQGPT